MIPPCFVCSSETICRHREIELVAHWRRVYAELTAVMPQAKPESIASYAEVVIMPNTVPIAPITPQRASGYRLNVTREDAMRRRV